ncbi:pectate lyase [Ferdinandcohnia sp. Marseille-Q9671]
MKKIIRIFLAFLILFSTVPNASSFKVSAASNLSDSPTGLQATAGDEKVDLKWNRSIGTGKSMLYVGSGLPADENAIAHLQTLGFNKITFKNIKETETADTEGFDIVFVGETSPSGDIGDKFKEIPIPVVYSKGWVVDDVDLSEKGSGLSGDIDGQTNLTIQDPYHPLAAGLSGTVQVYSKAGKVNFGTPGEEAEVIATVEGDDAKVSIFAYEKGAKRVTGEPVPARRVSTFVFNGQEEHMTADGWKLVDASVEWALGSEDDKPKMLYVGQDLPADVNGVRHFQSLGYLSVDFAVVKETEAADTEGYDIVFVAETSPSGDIKQKFRDIPIPVIYSKGYIVDDVGLSEKESGLFGDIDGQTNLVIQDSDHPLAAGLSGTVQVYSKAGKVNFGTPGPEANVIATVEGDDSKASIFAYEKGAKRVTGEPVPARRVSTFVFNGQEEHMTTEGWKLVDQSVIWALNLNEKDIAHEKTFTVKRSTNAEGPFEVIASGLEENAFTDTGLENGNTYYYQVSLVYRDGTQSNPSEVVSATPVDPLPTPTGLTAVPGNEQVNLSWNSVPEATSYNVKRSTEKGGSYNVIATGITETTYTDTSVKNGVVYYYVVSAENEVTTSADSTPIEVTPTDTRPAISLEESPSYVNEKMYTISGKINRKSTVTVNGEDVELKEDLTFSKTLELVAGENKITIEAIDTEGVAAAPVEVIVVYDTDAPALTIDRLEGEKDGDIYKTVYNPYPVSGTLSEDGYVYINGEKFEVADDFTFYAEVELEAGEENTLEIKGVDFAGNETKVVTYAVSPHIEAVPTGPIKIISTVVTKPNTVEVTFNGRVANLDLDDLELQSAMGDWNDGFNPKLTANITILNTKTYVNDQGQTVVVFETKETINEDGTIDRNSKEDPHNVPLLKASYYSDDLEKSIQQADYLISWQMDHGGWYKNWSDTKYRRMWDGKEPKSESYSFTHETEAGTTDNNATIDEILFLSVMYKETGLERFKESAVKGINFILESQYDKGGFPQMYPLVGGYADNATFNDNAMNRVLNALTLVAKKQYPFNSDIISDEVAQEAQDALDLSLDFLLKSQIKVDGKLTAWGQQHDPYTYEATYGRAFELPSISGFESVSVVAYLMSLPQTEEIKTAIDAALKWFDEVKLEGIRFERFDQENMKFFYEDPDAVTWYRFYEIGTNRPVFANRDGIMLHDFFKIEGDSKWMYMWAGDFASGLLNVEKTTGYFENRAYVSVIDDNSTNIAGQTLVVGDIHRIEPYQESPVDPEQPEEPEVPEQPEPEQPEKPGDSNDTEEPEDKNDSSDEKEKEHSEGSNKENELPKTATTMYNWLMFGGVLILAGLGIYLYQRKRHLQGN